MVGHLRRLYDMSRRATPHAAKCARTYMYIHRYTRPQKTKKNAYSRDPKLELLLLEIQINTTMYFRARESEAWSVAGWRAVTRV